MRLIDADRLNEAISADFQHLQTVDESAAFIFRNDIDESPTIDAAPVVHGQWVDDGRRTYCSECCCSLTIAQASFKHNHFCPSCGAKMDGDVK